MQMNLPFRRFAKFAVWSIGAFCIAGSAAAATYVVDIANPGAADGNAGTSAAPWKTLYALNSRSFSPGDVISVKSGTYVVATGGVWSAPSIRLTSSGTAAAPIVVKSETKHGAVIDCANGTAPPIGAAGISYVVWDGFVVKTCSASGVVVTDSTGITLQNLKVWGIRQAGTPGDNTNAISLLNAQQTWIRNNELFDVDSGVMHNGNGTGIKSYYSSGTLAENNFIHDTTGSAIYDKRGGVNNTYRYNLALRVSTPYMIGGETNKPTNNISFHNNVGVDIRTAFEIQQEVLNDIHIYNNTFVDYESGISTNNPDTPTAIPRIRFFNNLFARESSLDSSGGDPDRDVSGSYESSRNGQQFSLIDYNVYSPTGQRWVFANSTSSPAIFDNIGAWRTAFNKGFDFNGSVATPTFVNRATMDLRLASGSSLSGKARVGGVSSGAAIDPGAYANRNEVIGLLEGVDLTPISRVAVAPAPPSSVAVQ